MVEWNIMNGIINGALIGFLGAIILAMILIILAMIAMLIGQVPTLIGSTILGPVVLTIVFGLL